MSETEIEGVESQRDMGKLWRKQVWLVMVVAGGGTR